MDAAAEAPARAPHPPRLEGSAANIEIIVRVDDTALTRGHAEPGELCEIAGIGPVPVSVVRRWMAGDAFKAAIVTDGVDIRSIVHLGRKPIALQRTALAGTNGLQCSVEGCNATVGLEIDHLLEWAKSGHTTLDELTFLCPHHHGLKTTKGYRLGPLQPNGKRTLIPPPDGVGGSVLHTPTRPSRRRRRGSGSEVGDEAGEWQRRRGG